MRFGAAQGKVMFNKGLTGLSVNPGPAACRRTRPTARVKVEAKKKSRKCGSQELTGRRQTKWLQPLGKNPDHWMNTVNTRKA